MLPRPKKEHTSCGSVNSDEPRAPAFKTSASYLPPPPKKKGRPVGHTAIRARMRSKQTSILSLISPVPGEDFIKAIGSEIDVHDAELVDHFNRCIEEMRCVSKRTKSETNVTIILHHSQKTGPMRKRNKIVLCREDVLMVIDAAVISSGWARKQLQPEATFPAALHNALHRFGVPMGRWCPLFSEKRDESEYRNAAMVCVRKTLDLENYEAVITSSDGNDGSLVDDDADSCCTEIHDIDKKRGVVLLSPLARVTWDAENRDMWLCEPPFFQEKKETEPISRRVQCDNRKLFHPSVFSAACFSMLAGYDRNEGAVMSEYLLLRSILEGRVSQTESTPKKVRQCISAVSEWIDADDCGERTTFGVCIQFFISIQVALKASVQPKLDTNRHVKLVRIGSIGNEHSSKWARTDFVLRVFQRPEITPLDIFTSLVYLAKKMHVPEIIERGKAYVTWDKEHTFLYLHTSCLYHIEECVVPRLFAYPACRPQNALQVYPVILRNMLSGDPYAITSAIETFLSWCARSKTGVGAMLPMTHPRSLRLSLGHAYLLPLILERIGPKVGNIFSLFREPYVVGAGELFDVIQTPEKTFRGRKGDSDYGNIVTSIRAFASIESELSVRSSMKTGIDIFLRAGGVAIVDETTATILFGKKALDAGDFISSMPEHAELLRQLSIRMGEHAPRTSTTRALRVPMDIMGGSADARRISNIMLFEICADCRVPVRLAVNLFLSIENGDGSLLFPREHDVCLGGVVDQLILQKQGRLEMDYETMKRPFACPRPSFPTCAEKRGPCEGLRLALMNAEEISFFRHDIMKNQLVGTEQGGIMMLPQPCDMREMYKGSLSKGGIFLDMNADYILNMPDACFPIVKEPGEMPLYGSDFFPVWKSEILVGDGASVPRKTHLAPPFRGAHPDFVPCIVIYPIRFLCTRFQKECTRGQG